MKTETHQHAYLRLDLRTRYRSWKHNLEWAQRSTGFLNPQAGRNTTCWKLTDLLAWEPASSEIRGAIWN
jgi:hypothetical protein